MRGVRGTGMSSKLLISSLRVAWDQWTALGVAGTGKARSHAIDLEALILFTPALGETDPRLTTEALDWCARQSRRYVSVTRLRSLRKRLTDQNGALFDHFAAQVNANAAWNAGWPTPLHASKTHLSGKSQAPDLARATLVQLRLRSLFGTTARAEVILELLRPLFTDETSKASVTASALTNLGYTKPPIAEVLSDLTQIGVLDKYRRGNTDYYEPVNAATRALLALAGSFKLKTAPAWHLRLPVVAALLELEARASGKSRVIEAIEISKELDRHREALALLGIKPYQPTRSSSNVWDELAKWSEQNLLQ
jgi:hypothetical protein